MVGSAAYRMVSLLAEAGALPPPDDWAAANVLLYAITAKADLRRCVRARGLGVGVQRGLREGAARGTWKAGD